MRLLTPIIAWSLDSPKGNTLQKRPLTRGSVESHQVGSKAAAAAECEQGENVIRKIQGSPFGHHLSTFHAPDAGQPLKVQCFMLAATVRDLRSCTD